MKHICQYCNKEFSRKSNLTNHVNNTQYCINKRYVIHIQEQDVKIENMSHQHDIYKQNIQENHSIIIDKISSTYEEKLQQQKEEYENKIERLQDRIQELASRAIDHSSTTINKTSNRTNNYVNMPRFSKLTPEFVQQQVDEHYDQSYFVKGQKGVAQFAFNRLLKDDEGNLYLECTDPSRQVYRFKDDDGNIARDIKAKKLTAIMVDPIKGKTYEILGQIEMDDPSYKDRASDIAYQIRMIERDNTDMCKELSVLTSE